LDQHKEKRPRDETIREHFSYHFADYKERVVELLAKVVRVSVETVAITEAMASLDRTNWEI
jgi:predicted helicase